jgi:short-subunit dehydrogenase
MYYYYNNKTILITGAASGIGRRFTEIVSENSSATFVLWDLNLNSLNDFVALSDLQERATCFRVDVSIPDSIREAADLVQETQGVPDIIINCAGIVVGKPFHEHTFKEIEKSIAVNVLGSMWVCRAFLPGLIDRGTGHIVNIGSASGYIGNPNMSVYASSKWAVHGWTESLRLEFKAQYPGISITNIIPSYVKTGMFDGVKAPLMVPLLETNQLVNKMIKGISRRKYEVKAPFMVHLTPVLKTLLPRSVFDWLAGRVFGVYHSMDTFKGRSKSNKS